ncbi:hypothetical protein [Nannocystis exedens]|nr:hypothetical protein [Nannocystis exedens]
MIDYAVLCRAIEDWKAGNAPNIPVSSPVPVATETAVDSYEGVEAEAEADEEIVDTDVDAGEGEGEVGAGEGQQQDRTIVYQLPEIDEEEQA